MEIYGFEAYIGHSKKHKPTIQYDKRGEI